MQHLNPISLERSCFYLSEATRNPTEDLLDFFFYTTTTYFHGVPCPFAPARIFFFKDAVSSISSSLCTLIFSHVGQIYDLQVDHIQIGHLDHLDSNRYDRYDRYDRYEILRRICLLGHIQPRKSVPRTKIMDIVRAATQQQHELQAGHTDQVFILYIFNVDICLEISQSNKLGDR